MALCRQHAEPGIGVLIAALEEKTKPGIPLTAPIRRQFQGRVQKVWAGGPLQDPPQQGRMAADGNASPSSSLASWGPGRVCAQKGVLASVQSVKPR